MIGPRTMGKKKGRQSGGFASKSMKAAFAAEVQSRAQEVPRRPFAPTKQRKHLGSPASRASVVGTETHRPKLLLNQLRGILQERRLEDRVEDRVARRRRHQLANAMARNISTSNTYAAVPTNGDTERLKRNPPGWILHYHQNNDSENEYSKQRRTCVPSLQTQCIRVLGPAMPDYLDALGRETLHSVMDMFPSSTLAALSVAVSATVGMNNDLAYVVGKHNHVEKLSIHNNRSFMLQNEDTQQQDESEKQQCFLTNEGVQDLVPRLVPSTNNGLHDLPEDEQATDQQVPESWEPLEDANDHAEMEGCIRLKRLELVNACTVSAETMSTLLSKCSCITHLSLSGSLSWTSGHDLLLQLSSLLPNLQVLDVSFCSWVTEALLRAFWRSFQHQERQHDLDRSPCGVPVLCVRGCVSLSESSRQELMFEFPGSLVVTSQGPSSCFTGGINRNCRLLHSPSMEAEEWVESSLDATSGCS